MRLLTLPDGTVLNPEDIEAIEPTGILALHNEHRYYPDWTANEAAAEWQAALADAPDCPAEPPHIVYGARIHWASRKWCAHHDGVIGYGDNPAEACAAFDRAWRGEPEPDADPAPSVVIGKNTVRVLMDCLIPLGSVVPHWSDDRDCYVGAEGEPLAQWEIMDAGEARGEERLRLELRAALAADGVTLPEEHRKPPEPEEAEPEEWHRQPGLRISPAECVILHGALKQSGLLPERVETVAELMVVVRGVADRLQGIVDEAGLASEPEVPGHE